MSYIEIYRINTISYQTFTKSNAISTTKTSPITRTFITTTNPEITSTCSTCTPCTGSKTYGHNTTQQNTLNLTTETVEIRNSINETNLVLIPKPQISSINTNRVNIIIIVVFMSLLILTIVSVLLMYILHLKPKRTINQPVINVENIELQSFNLSNLKILKKMLKYIQSLLKMIRKIL
jgi:hypothetical protein